MLNTSVSITACFLIALTPTAQGRHKPMGALRLGVLYSISTPRVEFMKLINFSVTNYRSITSAHKIAMSDTTILIGKNNEGKSNLLRAIQVGMNLLQRHATRDRGRGIVSYVNQKDYDWKRDFPVQIQDRKSAKQSIFRLEFMLDEDEILEFKDEIGSNLNGSLPLEIKIGVSGTPEINLKKPGKNTKTLSSKSRRIAEFVASRIAFNYIPAVRTEREALEVVRRMLSLELRVLESNPKYQKALKLISDLQQPILDSLADRIKEPLSEFLPSIRGVTIEIPENSRRMGVRRDFDVIIDDGTPTNIEYKGDGVKSLAALGLLKSKGNRRGASIVAIEEPESHLHPGAIHQVNDIICSLSENNQVILTTHNPLFVDRVDPKTNIIVHEGKATAAKSIGAIRDLLGIKASDNLTNANYVLVVEGQDDATSLGALLPYLSEKVGKTLRNNMLVIEPIGGAGNLSYKLSLLKSQLCITHCLLDHDDAGESAFNKVQSEGLVDLASCTFVNCNGMPQSEFEDCLNLDLYKRAIHLEFGVDLEVCSFKNRKKWSERVRDTFLDQGKLFNNSVLAKVKETVANEVRKQPKNALNPHKRNSIDALVKALESLIVD